MNQKFEIPGNKFNAAMFDLLFNLYAEVQAMRDIMLTEYVTQTNENHEEIKDAYEERRKSATRTIAAQIKTHYSDFDVDNFLSNYLD
jgi:hypothetical protein